MLAKVLIFTYRLIFHHLISSNILLSEIIEISLFIHLQNIKLFGILPTENLSISGYEIRIKNESKILSTSLKTNSKYSKLPISSSISIVKFLLNVTTNMDKRLSSNEKTFLLFSPPSSKKFSAIGE